MYTVGLDVDKLVSTYEYIYSSIKILLYAGNSWISSPYDYIAHGTTCLYKYDQTGQLAGNFGFGKKARAFFTCKTTYNNYSDLPLISEHVPNHNRDLNKEDFGYFLAGLIEGNGGFRKKELHIIFAEHDVSLAYNIKKKIGYGKVSNIKGKKQVKYICNHSTGISLILSYINGKFVSKYKYEELINHSYNDEFNFNILPPLNKLSLDNYWLAGFTQTNGGFFINVLLNSEIEKTGYSVKLEYSLKHRDDLPLNLLYLILKNGDISQSMSGISCYKSTDFKTAANLINYFDKFNVFTGKYKDYLKFRKVYIMITEGKHVQDKGIKKIISISSKGSSETRTQEI